MSATAIIRAEGEGEHLWFYGGGIFTIKATAAETGGSFFMFEDTMAQGKTTPLHLHPNEEEALYVIEGELLVHVGGENHRLSGGVSAWHREECRTPCSLPRRAPGCLRCWCREGPRPSTVGRVSRRAQVLTPPDRSTSIGSACRPSATAASRSSAHPRSTSLKSALQSRRRPDRPTRLAAGGDA